MLVTSFIWNHRRMSNKWKVVNKAHILWYLLKQGRLPKWEFKCSLEKVYKGNRFNDNCANHYPAPLAKHLFSHTDDEASTVPLKHFRKSDGFCFPFAPFRF